MKPVHRINKRQPSVSDNEHFSRYNNMHYGMGYDVTGQFENNNAKAGTQPERSLWYAVLTLAGEDILYAKTLAKAEAVFKWFLSFERRPGSFNWICSVLDMNPSYWRKKAYELLERRKRNGGPFLTEKAIRRADQAREEHKAVLRAEQPEQRDDSHPSDSRQKESNLSRVV